MMNTFSNPGGVVVFCKYIYGLPHWGSFRLEYAQVKHNQYGIFHTILSMRISQATFLQGAVCIIFYLLPLQLKEFTQHVHRRQRYSKAWCTDRLPEVRSSPWLARIVAFYLSLRATGSYFRSLKRFRRSRGGAIVIFTFGLHSRATPADGIQWRREGTSMIRNALPCGNIHNGYINAQSPN